MKLCRHLLLITACLLLAGCTTYVTRTASGIDLQRYKKIFVENNLSDNHRIELLLVNSLQALGLEAQSGPPTLKPDNVHAVLKYSDHWTWDFSEHISAMSIELYDAKGRIVGTAHFSGPLSLHTSAQAIVDRLVRDLFEAKPAGKKS